MSRFAAFISVLVAAFFVTNAPAPASGAEMETFDKLANITFSGPVQFPGVTLNAGTYRFRLADPTSSRNIVQVMSHDGLDSYGIFYTIPDSRMEVTDDPVLTFRETPAGVPAVVRSLFYGGEHNGYEFLWAGVKPVMTPEVTPQPPITYSYSPSPAAAAPEPKPAAEPPPPPVVSEPAPEAAVLPAEPAAEPAQAPAELPKTATPLPLFAVGGFASLLAGLGAGLLRRRLS